MGERKAGKRTLREASKDSSTIWIGISASEANLERLSALLLFCDRDTILRVDPEPDGPLPWEEPVEKAPPTEVSESVDYDHVTRAIAVLLSQYVKKHGEEKAREVLVSFGAPRLSQVPTYQLLSLHAALEAALQAEPKTEGR